MPIEFNCEACGAKLRVDQSVAGKKVKCPQCSAVVSARGADESAAAASPFAEGASPSGPMDDANPYASPTTLPESDLGEPAPDEAQNLTPGIRQAMSQTRPWVLFLSVLGFVAGALMAFAFLGMTVGAVLTQELFMVVPAVMYGLTAGFYLVSAYYLLLYGVRIGTFRMTHRVADLEAALLAQRSFWRLVGVLAAIGLALFVLGFAGLFLGSLAWGLRI